MAGALATREESTRRQEQKRQETLRRQEAGEAAIQNSDRHEIGTERRGETDGNKAPGGSPVGGNNPGQQGGTTGGGGVNGVPTLGVHLNKLASIFEKTPAAGDAQWLANVVGSNLQKVKTWFNAQVAYLKGITFGDVAGGAKALWGMIKNGEWGQIGEAIKGAPVVAQVAGVGAIAGVLLLGGAAVAGGQAVLGKVAASSVGKWLLGAGGVTGASIAANWGVFFHNAEQAMNFNWLASDASLFRGIKQAIERLYEPMGGALGKACASVLVGRSTGTMKININVRTLAMATLIGTDDKSPAEEAMAEALTEMCGALRRVGAQIMATLTFMGGRKIANYITGNNWGDDEKASFVPAKKLGEIKEQMLKPLNLDEKLSEALEEFGEEFYDTLKEIMTDEDTWVNFVRA